MHLDLAGDNCKEDMVAHEKWGTSTCCQWHILSFPPLHNNINIKMPVALRECDIWCLNITEQQIVRVLEKMMFRGKLGSDKQITRKLRELNDEKASDCSNIIILVKSSSSCSKRGLGVFPVP
jgi:hypothetical protein